MLWVGVDVGGTFTDVVVYDETSGTLEVGKAPTHPADPSVGFLNAFDKLKLDLTRTGRVVHGTTIGTNAILERKGATVGLLTTRGFRDTLEIARTNRTTLYDIRALKPAPLAARQHIVEVDERLAADGAVVRPLDEGAVRAALDRLRAAAADGGANGDRALVVCFLHSYANPAHERAAARLATETLPGWFVSTSAEVLPEMREYERFSTAVLNAYIGPKVGGYLTRLSAALAARGYPGELFITTSSGGIMTAPRAARFPVHTVLSGPAGGVAAGLALGRLTGFRNLITYDMGGTSTDVCLIGDLEATLTTEQHIAGLPNRTPQIEINSIGAGGGSLAWIDAGGALRVGPRSAGADPGPACYGRGGADATITDANLVLGRVPADRPLAGEVPLDLDLARRAVSRLVPRVPGVAGEAELADGIVRIAVARMVSAIKEISIGKGHDPRDFVLLAYGGAGPMHAAFIADELEIPRVLVPTAPGNFSAFGSLISDLRHDHVRTRLVNTRHGDFAEVEAIFAELEAEARATLEREGIGAEAVRLGARARHALRRPVVGAAGPLAGRGRLDGRPGSGVPPGPRAPVRPRQRRRDRDRELPGHRGRRDRQARAPALAGRGPGRGRAARRARRLLRRRLRRGAGLRARPAATRRPVRGPGHRRGDGVHHRRPAPLGGRGGRARGDRSLEEHV